MKKRNHCCCMCGKEATWFNTKKDGSNSLYYCDDCVPRISMESILNIEDWGEPIEGINVMWWDENSFGKDFLKDGDLERKPNSYYYVYLNRDNKRIPSDNFAHNSKGFPKKEKKHLLNQIQIMSAYTNNLSLLTKMEAKKVGSDITEILTDKRSYELMREIPYNLFMSRLGDSFKKMKLTLAYRNNYQNFYKEFKRELSEIKS